MKFLDTKSLALCALTLMLGITVASPARADWDRDDYRGPRPYYGYAEPYHRHHRYPPPPVYVVRPQPRVVYMQPAPMPMPVYRAPAYYPGGLTFAFNIR